MILETLRKIVKRVLKYQSCRLKTCMNLGYFTTLSTAQNRQCRSDCITKQDGARLTL